MRARVLAGLVLATPLVLTPVLATAQSELVLEPMRKGVALFQAGRYREAEPLIKEALRQSERELGLDALSTAAVHTTLANLYRRQGGRGTAPARLGH
jgi:hypothetical protein